MDCCQCQGIEKVFDEGQARKDLKRYRKKGPDSTTRILVDAIKAQGVQDLSLLDIGGGVGAIQHGLLDAGAREAVSVDASTGYAEVAKGEAERLGYSDRVTYRQGNFVEMAPGIEPADVVTLDRVICCYHDVEKLVGMSSQRATSLYGVVFPRDNWLSRAAIGIGNLYMRLRRNPFRAFVHPTSLVDSLVTGNGLSRCFYRKTLVWQVVVYAR